MSGLDTVMGKIKAFLDQRKSGQVTLEIRDGNIVACKLSESIRIPIDSQPFDAPLEYKTNR